ncbi:MAG: class I SAM-dependent methyltransferase [Nitrospira sp.]|nr:class I SAM-dependent methyltransferase [Nitrospira sp.]
MSHAAAIEMESVVCPCGRGASPSEAFHASTRRYVACPACGLVFLSPRPSSTEVEEYYRENYDGSYGAAESSADRQPVFASVLAHLLEWRKPPGRLLDIGCGDGAFMMLCREAGWTCSGVEVSQGAAARARAKGHEVLSPVDLDHLTSGRFDAVTLVNVLETVTDPAAMIGAMTRQMTSQGMLAIRVSNGLFHHAVRTPVRWCGAQYDQAFHLFSYSPNALRTLVEHCGFEVLSLRNSAPSLGPVTSAHSWGRRLKWRLVGGGLSLAAALAYRLSAGRLVWAPSFELIARRKTGVRECDHV